jgi:hypothetical protein
MSRRHFLVEIDNNGWPTIMDLGSSNGTSLIWLPGYPFRWSEALVQLNMGVLAEARYPRTSVEIVEDADGRLDPSRLPSKPGDRILKFVSDNDGRLTVASILALSKEYLGGKWLSGEVDVTPMGVPPSTAEAICRHNRFSVNRNLLLRSL